MPQVGEDDADAGYSVGPKPRPNGTLRAYWVSYDLVAKALAVANKAI